MNREIEFRGYSWEKVWVFGYMYKIEIDGNTFAWIVNKEGHISVNPKTTSQFTGMTDKNGVKIWEGDLLDFDPKEWGGEFTPEVITMEKLIGKWEYCGNLSDVSQFRTVIGNIHQHKHLLDK